MSSTPDLTNAGVDAIFEKRPPRASKKKNQWQDTYHLQTFSSVARLSR